MSSYDFLLRHWTTLTVVGVSLLCNSWSMQLDAQEPAKQGTTEQEAATEEEAPEAEAYPVPDGTPAEILSFIQKLQSQRPKGKDRAEMIVDYLKIQNTVLKAADKLDDAKTSVKQDGRVIQARMRALKSITRFSSDKEAAKKAQDDFIAKLAKDERPLIVMIYKTYQLQLKAVALQQQIRSGVTDKDAVKQIVKDLKDLIKDAEPLSDHLSLIAIVAGILERSDGSEAAVEMYRTGGEFLAKSDDKNIALRGKKMIGTARRKGLVGGPIKVFGKFLDGREVNWADYKGKVVLIDYWATWCGPCIRELPNVVKNYKIYHERGFDVIGISLDSSRSKVQQFVKAREIPWKTLFDDGKDTSAWNHPMSTYYGVSGIPTVILVNKEGNVVSLNARGSKLGKLLEELLGPIEVEDADKDSDKDADASDDAK